MTWNLADLFESVVDVVADRTAVVVPNSPSGRIAFTFAELDERSNRLAHAFAERGVGAGDHVGIYAYNGNQWAETQWAAWKLRAVPVNVNYRYVEAELRYLFDNADLAAVVHGAEFAGRIAAVRDSCPTLRTCLAFDDGSGADISVCDGEDYESALASASPDRLDVTRSADDLYMLYTGGTTGMPKGVMWRQEDFIHATVLPMLTVMEPPITSEDELPQRAAERTPMFGFPLAPLMHGAAQWSSIQSALGGHRMILSASRGMDPAEVWGIVTDEKAQVLNLVGDAQARPLIDYVETHPDLDLSSLFVVSSGGAILSPAVKASFATHLPNTIIIDALGASETGFQGSHAGVDNEGHPQFLFGDHTIVIDDEGVPTVPGDGVVGRLARRGHIPLGYYKDEAKTAETFPTIGGQRWVIPGDFAVTEADGRITLLGRGSVSINSGGEKIFPEEVESALKGHPAVFDAVVVGVRDERWGERVTAVIRARDGHAPDLESLVEHCRTLIAGYKVPRALVLVDEMQRSPSGKADYRWAKAVANGEIEA